MKVYISGKITGLSPYWTAQKFGYASAKLRAQGHSPVNPYAMNRDNSLYLDYEDIMRLCFAAIEICDAVYMLRDWKESPGAVREHTYALEQGKEIIYEVEDAKE